MAQPFLYSVEREFQSSIEELWSAWIEADKLEQWYHPTDLKSVPGATHSDLNIDGLWSCAVDVPQFGFIAYFFGKYTHIEEFVRIDHTMIYTQDKSEFEKKDFQKPSHLIRIDFEKRDDLAWVRFAQYGEMPEGQAAQAQAGMESYFDSLSQFLASSNRKF